MKSNGIFNTFPDHNGKYLQKEIEDRLTVESRKSTIVDYSLY